MQSAVDDHVSIDPLDIDWQELPADAKNAYWWFVDAYRCLADVTDDNRWWPMFTWLWPTFFVSIKTIQLFQLWKLTRPRLWFAWSATENESADPTTLKSIPTRYKHSFIHWLSHLFIHNVIHSLQLWKAYQWGINIDSFIHSYIHLFIHLFKMSFVYTFITILKSILTRYKHSFIHSFIYL